MDNRKSPGVAVQIKMPPKRTSEIQVNGRKPFRNGKKTLLRVCIAVASVFVILLIAAFCIVNVHSKDITVEVGGRPDYSHITANGFANFICKIETDIAEIDTSKPSEMQVPLRFFGFIKAISTLYIVDTVKPEVEAQNVFVTLGAEITADMFVREIIDKTDVTVEFLAPVDTSVAVGETSVSLSATDEGGNAVKFESKLTVIDPKDDFSFEYGVSIDEIRSKILSVVPRMEDMDLSGVEDCGEFTVKAENDGTAYFVQISISDRKAPVAEVSSFDIILGEEIPEDEIVKNIVDHSEVTVEFLTPADYNKAGEQAIDIRLTDAHGNFTEYTSYIRIHDIHDEITAEIGSSDEALSRLIFNDDWSESCLAYDKNNVTSGMGLGAHKVTLYGKYNDISVNVNIVDTNAPELSLMAASYLVGRTPEINDFILECRDATSVTYSFKTLPDSSAEGTYDVTVVATDTSGNRSEQTTQVTFFRDITPPVIRGHENISLISGETCDFSHGVSAYDDIWGEVKVDFDPSSVDLNTPGTYSLVYTAADGSGNLAKACVTVTVREPLYVCLDVENIMQKPRLPNGCEVVSLAIALKYSGCSVDAVELYDEYMPKSPLRDGDPWTTYVGDAKGLGFGCYAPCVIETGNKYLSSVGSSKTVLDVSGWDMSYYENLIDSGSPVIMWGTIGMNGNSKVCWEDTVDGKEVLWHSYSHCLVMIGYTDYTYIFCDPLKGIVEYDKEDVEESFEINFKQACVVW